MKKIIIAVCIVAAGGLVWWFVFHNAPDSPRPSPETIPSPQAQPNASSNVTPTSSPSAVKPAVKKKPTPTPSALQAAQTYQEALAIYGVSGFRFQFSECHAQPGRLVLKVGQKFMLDNRDGTARTVAVGQKSYALGAYGFTVASAPMLPGGYYITCNGGGTGSIEVQP